MPDAILASPAVATIGAVATADGAAAVVPPEPVAACAFADSLTAFWDIRLLYCDCLSSDTLLNFKSFIDEVVVLPPLLLPFTGSIAVGPDVLQPLSKYIEAAAATFIIILFLNIFLLLYFYKPIVER